MALYDDNTDRVVLTTIIDSLMARLDEKDKTIDSKDELISVKDSLLAAKDEIIKSLETNVAELTAAMANLKETLEEFQRRFFGISSEKTKNALTDGDEDADEDQLPEIKVKEHTRKPRKPKRCRDDIYAALPVDEVKIPVAKKDRICHDCGAEMKHLGYKTIREELRMIPAKFFRAKLMAETMFCPCCREEDDATIVTAQVPKALLPHSPASQSTVTEVMCQKSDLHVPFYRQEHEWEQKGCPLPRETAANWYNTCALEYLLPVYEALHSQFVHREIIHMDETTCQVLHEKDKSATSASYMFIYTSGSDGLPPITLYDYCSSRHGYHAADFLKGFNGMAHCDGYQGYLQLEDVVLVCCLAHARRKFFEAVPANRKRKLRLLDINSEQEIPEPDTEQLDDPGVTPGEKGVIYCNRLFYLERKYKDLTPDERKSKRLETEPQIWASFWEWMDTLNPAGGSKLETAVNYAQNHHDKLMNYLRDGRCELSNNRAERKAKVYATGRKNFLFHDTEDGAKASAIVLSLIDTAKSNGLNVYQYLYTLLLYMPDYKNEPAGIEQLMPWSDFIKEHCSGLADTENITPENKPDLLSGKK